MFNKHPKGLARLFFIEMWERLAFYTMVGILLLYTIDTEAGGLGLPRIQGNEIYGLYLAFVYLTPYLGGLIADRFIGYRRAVLIGGAFFALGFFLMSIHGQTTFVSGLVCLCIGNGFFKPNISVMVGNLYQKGDPKRDAGFSIFYMGINIGAFIANFLASFARNELGGWPAVFRCAGAGMLIGVTILLLSWKVLENADRRPERSPDDVAFGSILGKILGPAFAIGIGAYFFAQEYVPSTMMRPAVFGFLLGMVPILIFFIRLGIKAPPAEKPGLLSLLPVYLAGATFFMVLHLNGSAMTAWALDQTNRDIALPAMFKHDALPSYYHNASPATPRPNKANLLPVASDELANMFGQNRMSRDALAQLRGGLPAGVEVIDIPLDAAQRSPEHNAFDVRGADIYETVTVKSETDSHGLPVITVASPEGSKPIARAAFVRTLEGGQKLPLFVTTQRMFDRMYEGSPPELAPGTYLQVANSEIFQSLNALFVIGFTPIVIWFFAFLQRRGIDFSTARKIFVGMALTALSLLLMVLAGVVGGNGEAKVSWLWLLLFYAVITFGELCLSPMALSLVTKLSPKRLVGLTMGGWFLATSFGNNFSGFFGGMSSTMSPTSFFLVLAAISGTVCLVIGLLLPKLDKALKQYGA